MSGRASALVQALLPQKLSGRFIYRLSRSRRPWLKNLLIAGFCRIFDIDLDEAEIPERTAYPSFNSFFTRRLKAGARPVAAAEDAVASPADGRLTEFGLIEDDRLLQAKGRYYTVDALLAESPGLVEPFRGGSFLTVYLAPHNYHRIHAPVAGRLERERYVPGRRFSVNAATAASIDGLYCRNERVALWLATPIGHCVVVMVGALNVASLSTCLSGEIPSGTGRLVSPASAPAIGRGEELGQFNLGSTVVMLFPRGTVEWLAGLKAGQPLRMGEALGRVVASAAR